MLKKKLRIGIELNHVIRDINKQIAKYYQKDFDGSIDLDSLDYKDDILHEVCDFDTEEDMLNFVYFEYPLEIFGHALECDRFLSRDLNFWIRDLGIKDKSGYEYEFFFYSMKEMDLTIQSSYFFLSKVGSRLRKVVFPKSYEELESCGDIFITADEKVAKFKDKGIIVIKNNFNQKAGENADFIYDSFRDFLDDDNKLNNIIGCQKTKSHGLWTSIASWITCLMNTIETKSRQLLKKITN